MATENKALQLVYLSRASGNKVSEGSSTSTRCNTALRSLEIPGGGGGTGLLPPPPPTSELLFNNKGNISPSKNSIYFYNYLIKHKHLPSFLFHFLLTALVFQSVKRPPQWLSRESTGSLSLSVVRARFEPLRRSLFAPDWDCLRSVAAAALKAS